MHLKSGDDPVAAVNQLASQGVSLVVADLPADALLKAADAGKAHGTLFFNAAAPDDRLREEDCRANVMHTAPTRAMLADALAQYLIWKKWKRWLLVVGPHESDKLYADAIKRAAKRFGGKIVEERAFKDTGGARRTDGGYEQIQQQIPIFTQEAPSYDVLVVADEATCSATTCPIAPGTRAPSPAPPGLVPTSWHRRHELWGGDPVAEPLQHAVQAADDAPSTTSLDSRRA